MFIKNHKAALSSCQTDLKQYMRDGVVVDNDGYLSVMLPITRNAIAIKFAEKDPVVAKMVAHALALFEKLCTNDDAYGFYQLIMESDKLHDRVMQFVTMMIANHEPMGTLTISKAVDKKHGKLLSDVRLIGDSFGFYDKEAKTFSHGITRTSHPNGMTKELMLPPEIISLLMCHYIDGQRVLAMMPW